MLLNRFLSSVLVVLAAFLVAGCASVGNKADPAALTGKSIAVASSAGKAIRYLWVGTTVFNNEERLAPFPGGKLDRAIEETLVEVLRGTNRYSKVSMVPAQFDVPLDHLRSIGTDYLLLVEAGAGADSRFHTNQYFRGIGLFQRSVLGSRPGAYGHVAVKLSLIKVSTGEVIARSEEVNSWPSDVALSAGPSLSAADTVAFETKLLYRAPGVVASALEPLGVR